MTWMTARMAALSVALVSGGIATAGNGVRAAPAVTGLDHIPIAVRDLEAAAERYRALGFSLKPGRPHENGIRNEHVKFPDGTELELITAPEARDRLTTTYRKHLAGGDGPAFLAFFAQTVDDAVRQLAPPYVFFGPRNHSPTDRPEHFAHASGADSLISVWLAGDDLSRERRLLQAIGATLERRSVHAPDAFAAEIARHPEGTVLLLPGERQAVPGRPIAGAGSGSSCAKSADRATARPRTASTTLTPAR